MNIKTFRKKLYFLFLMSLLLTGAFEIAYAAGDPEKRDRRKHNAFAARKDAAHKRFLKRLGKTPNPSSENAVERLKQDGVYESLIDAVNAARQDDEVISDAVALDTVSQTAKLTNNGGVLDEFGLSVAISGDTAVVGVPYDSRAAKEQGAAYVFVRTGGVWTEQARLVASDGLAEDLFGFGVAISGNTVVIGAPTDDGAFLEQGSAYIFTRSGTTWTQQAQLTASDAATGDSFGTNVGISGETVVVGAPDNAIAAANDNRGAAYVFVRGGTTWTQQAQLTANVSADAFFGIAVAVSGDSIVVGAFGDTVAGNFFQGSAFVFVRSGATWAQQAQLVAGGGTVDDDFGTSVAIDGNTAVVGAPSDDVNGNTDQGSAYVFVRSGAAWAQQSQLNGAGGAAIDSFGYSVSVSGDNVIVGATFDDVGANAAQGSAYIFTRSGTAWTQHQQLTANDGAAEDLFGVSVSVSGSNFIAGANADDIGANVDQGSAYIFAPATTAPVITSISPNTRGAGGIAFEITVDGSGFSSDSIVRWNGQNRATTFVSTTQLKAQILASDVSAVGQFPVTVFNPTTNGGTSNAVNFTVTACVYSLNPTSQNFAAAGGNGSFAITATVGCGYTAASGASWITVTGTASGVGSGTISFTVAANTGVARTGTITVGGQTFTVTQAAGTAPAPRKAFFDYDGDKRADISLFRPSDRVWYIQNSGGGVSFTQFGLATDKIVPADYDGDGKTDIAVFRPETGVWFITKSTGGFQFVQFGTAEDLPQPGDFNGDGKAEVAVWRPSTGVWFILNTETFVSTATQYGASEDKPVAADYDGDGKTEIAVYRPSLGVWFLYNATTGQTNATRFGIATDKPVQADYDGDGKTDIALYRPSEGNWYILPSTGGFTVTKFGLSTDQPTPADYDGDGKTDFAVYRASEGNWYLLQSTQGFNIIRFGINVDKPTPGAFVY